MKFTHHLSRRLAVGIGLAASAILLPTAALAAGAGPIASSRPASIPKCVAAHTTVWLGWPGDGSAGHFTYQVQISNVGKASCTLRGYPGVSGLNSGGKQVGLPAGRTASTTPLVTLAPGATAHAVLVITDPGALGCPILSAVTLRVYAPNQAGANYVPLAFQVCKGKVSMNVDAVHPGAGIPGYTIS